MPDQPNLFVSQHPAVLHKLAIMRDERTDSKKFRELVREISWLLGYEALADTPLNEVEVTTPLELTTGHQLAERIGLVPILRAGLGMVDAFLELYPESQVWHLGLFRDERTLRPVEYYNIYCASLDRQLNDKGYIQPGLGDAGDRQFGTGF